LWTKYIVTELCGIRVPCYKTLGTEYLAAELCGLRMTPRDVETSRGLIFVINCILLGTYIAGYITGKCKNRHSVGTTKYIELMKSLYCGLQKEIT
jgi:hypothetical protein